MRIILCIIFIFVSITNLISQDQSITLKFTADYTCSHIQLDSVLIENITQDYNHTIYYPDTSITFTVTGFENIDIENNELKVYQNYPNPFSSKTYLDIFVPEHDLLCLSVYDLMGKVIATYEAEFSRGLHNFSFQACSQHTYILRATSTKHAQKQVMIQLGSNKSSNAQIIYEGISSSIYHKSDINKKATELPFSMGDQLRFTAYITNYTSNVDSETIVDAPLNDSLYFFDINPHIPDTPTNISGDNTVYPNTDGLIYEVADMPGSTFHWTLPEGWTITDGENTHSITVTSGTESGEITVYAENGCGAGSEQSMEVTIHFMLTLESEPSNGGSTSGSGDYPAGEFVVIEAYPEEGFLFNNWSGAIENIDDPGSENTQITMPANNITITANFEQQEYQLTLGANPADGGNIEGEGIYYFEDEIIISAIPNEGFAFINWTGDIQHIDDPGSATPTLIMPSEDISLTANFEMVNYDLSIIVNPEIGGSVMGEGSYNFGDQVIISASANESYEFINWTDANDEVLSTNPEYSFNMPSEDLVLTANFEYPSTFDFVIETTAEQTEFSFIIENALDIELDWGDGTQEEHNGHVVLMHDYGEAGLWTIKVRGQANRIAFYYFIWPDTEPTHIYPQMLKDVLTPVSAGVTGITSALQMFRNTQVAEFTCANFFDDTIGNVTNMIYMFASSSFNMDISHWDVSNVTSMEGLFASSDFNQDISSWDVSSVTSTRTMFFHTDYNYDLSLWDVSNVTDMGDMFCGATFNQDIGNWDVSSVEDMSGTFRNSEFNQDISQWDVSNVINMRFMFLGSVFNQDIGSWNVSNVTDMSYMFSFNSVFNQDISSWDVSSVISMKGMFMWYSEFNQDISSWNVGNVTDMSEMFYTNFTFNQDISSWDVSNVTDMSKMFYRNSIFNQDVSLWNVSNVTNMSSMFSSSVFNQDISLWNVSSVTNMSAMFSSSVFNQDISLWNVSSVTNMSEMFRSSVFNQDISQWDVSNVQDMSYMFSNNNAFNQGVNQWNVSNVTNMAGMFEESIFNQDLSSWDVSNVTNMSHMFEESIFNQDISSWDVSNVTNMSHMFKNSEFNQNIGSWNVGSVTNMSSMFYNSNALNPSFNQDIGLWNVVNVTDMSHMFYNTDFNQDLSGWNVSNVIIMTSMFSDTPFNHDISQWDVSSVTHMDRMFINSGFNQDISAWDVSNVTTMEYFLTNNSFPVETYNNILIEWSYLNLQNGVDFRPGFSYYDYGEPADRRQYIIDQFGWEIHDKGALYPLSLVASPESQGTVEGDGNYPEDEVLTLTATPNDGYFFNSWTDEDGTILSYLPVLTYTMPGEPVTLYANFSLFEDDNYGDGITDIDGNNYLTVIIGDQEWMAENLRTTRYRDGSAIATNFTYEEWDELDYGAYAIYDHEGGIWDEPEDVEGITSDEEMVEAYGKLYNWYAVTDDRGLCPTGWRTPSQEDIDEMRDYIIAQIEEATNMTVGRYLKSCRMINSPLGNECATSDHPRWNESSSTGTDDFNFAILPAGHIRVNVGSEGIGNGADFWTSTEYDTGDSGYKVRLTNSYGTFSGAYITKKSGYSVRCIKNN